MAAADFRLFLPEAWVKDAKRCAKGKVPEGQRRHRTKTELALEMIQAVRERGSRHAWIGGDEVYGNNNAFTCGPEELGETFLMDVAANRRVRTSELCAPQPSAAPRRRGRPFTRPDAPDGMVAVEALAREHFEAKAREITVRGTAKCPLRVRVWAERVWQHDGQRTRPRWLVVREHADRSRKYSLAIRPPGPLGNALPSCRPSASGSNALSRTPRASLAWPTTNCAAGPAGDHQVALVCLAQLFTLVERRLAKRSRPLLSVRDTTELLEVYLPRRHRARENYIRRRSKPARQKPRIILIKWN